jgi:mRNA-degrading endonuclease toxin of MazEF toxin-antitoxin module
VICEFADIVVVPFPFLEKPVSKRRPALVFSTAEFNSVNGHSALAMITTAAGSAWPSDVAIDGELETAISRQSYIRWKLFTLPNQLILRRLGRLAEGNRREVAAFARRSFAASA